VAKNLLFLLGFPKLGYLTPYLHLKEQLICASDSHFGVTIHVLRLLHI